MNKCLKIMFNGDFPENFLQSFIHKHAKKLQIEGMAQITDAGSKMRIIACGQKESIDEFLDILHKGSANFVPENLEVEPFLKDKEYRGVFRIIE